MAASASVTISLRVADLLSQSLNGSLSFTGAVPNAGIGYIKELSVTDTAEVLSLSDVSVIEGVYIRCISDTLEVDCNYSAAFSADIVIAAGEAAYFKPKGIIRVMNVDSDGKKPVYEVIVFGTR